jgi:hypothetical protein
MPQPSTPRPWTIRLFFVLFVIVFGFFHYVVQHYHHVPGGGSYVDWDARGLVLSVAGTAVSLWVIVWLNRRFSK